MHLLLTGAAGYVGSAVTARLLARGWQVTAFNRLLFGAEALLPFAAHPSFRLVVGDVRDTRALTEAAAGVDGIVHLAAVVGEAACAVDDAAAWSISIDGTKSMLVAARAANVPRVLLVSTCSNYGVAGPDVIADEDAALNPLSRYAEAKVQAEQFTLAANGPVTTTVLRFGTICGLSARMRFNLLVSEMARAAARDEAIALYTPDAWRPFLHVQDAGRAIECWADAAAELIAGRVFNVVGENYQKRALGDTVRRHYPGARIAIADRAADARDYRVSAARIARVLGFRPSKTVEDAFLETADAVAKGIFRDAGWAGHSAVPADAAALQFAAAADMVR